MPNSLSTERGTAAITTLLPLYNITRQIEFEITDVPFVSVIGGSWFKYMREWWKYRHEPNVLVMNYFDMKRVSRTHIIILGNASTVSTYMYMWIIV